MYIWYERYKSRTRIINYLDLNQKKENEKNSNDKINIFNNEEEIKNFYELYFNNKKINFFLKYKFMSEGENIIKIKCKNPLKNMNYLFYNCSSLISLNLSNFNTINVN
jgi:surface protein